MSAVVDFQPTASAANGTANKAKRAKPIERFPFKFHYCISENMEASLRRLTGANSLLAGADIGRLSLHLYLLQNDPLYARAMSNGYAGV